MTMLRNLLACPRSITSMVLVLIIIGRLSFIQNQMAKLSDSTKLWNNWCLSLWHPTCWEEILLEAFLASRISVRSTVERAIVLSSLRMKEGLQGSWQGFLTWKAKCSSRNTKSCKYNHARLERWANAKEIHVGDSVILRSHDRASLTTEWDQEYKVTCVSGMTCYLCHQTTRKTKEGPSIHVHVVDPNLIWDRIQPRLARTAPEPTADNWSTFQQHQQSLLTTVGQRRYESWTNWVPGGG